MESVPYTRTRSRVCHNNNFNEIQIEFTVFDRRRYVVAGRRTQFEHSVCEREREKECTKDFCTLQKILRYRDAKRKVALTMPSFDLAATIKKTPPCALQYFLSTSLLDVNSLFATTNQSFASACDTDAPTHLVANLYDGVDVMLTTCNVFIDVARRSNNDLLPEKPSRQTSSKRLWVG